MAFMSLSQASALILPEPYCDTKWTLSTPSLMTIVEISVVREQIMAKSVSTFV